MLSTLIKVSFVLSLFLMALPSAGQVNYYNGGNTVFGYGTNTTLFGAGSSGKSTSRGRAYRSRIGVHASYVHGLLGDVPQGQTPISDASGYSIGLAFTNLGLAIGPLTLAGDMTISYYNVRKSESATSGPLTTKYDLIINGVEFSSNF